MSHLLFKAVEKGDLKKVTDLLDQGADAAWTHKGTGRTALSQAAIDGHLPIAQLLIDRGADINWRDTAVGMTPLGWACYMGHIELVRFLLQQGADYNLPTPGFSLSPLMNAIQSECPQLEIIQLLLMAGADVNAMTSDGRNALSIAENNRRTDIVELLKKAGGQAPVPPEEPTTIAWPDVGERGNLVDYSQPESVLRAFILAMNQSELDANEVWEKDRNNPPFEMVIQTQRDIFQKYCTPKERAYGRSGSFSSQPDYEPEESLHVIDLISTSRAELHTRQGTNRSLRYENLYVLLKKKGRWLVDSKKDRCIGHDKWANTIL